MIHSLSCRLSVLRSRPVAIATFAITVTFFLLGCAACTPPPPTNSAEVFDYVRNALIGAAVRRLDATEQRFVDELLKTHASLKKAQSTVLAMQNARALWPKKDPRWRNLMAIHAQIKILTTWLADQPSTHKKDPAQKPQPTRKMLIQTIHKIQQSAPTYTAQNPTERTAWLASIEQLMQPQITAERDCQRIVQRYLAFYSLVAKHYWLLRPETIGLQFIDPTIHSQINTQWDRLHSALLTDKIASPLPDVSTLAAQEKRRSQAILEKQTLRKKGLLDLRTLRRYRRLELEVHYLDRVVTLLRKQKEAQQKAALTQSQSADERIQKLEQRLGTLEQKIHTLEAKNKLLQARVKSAPSIVIIKDDTRLTVPASLPASLPTR